jgi:hypothetical protein
MFKSEPKWLGLDDSESTWEPVSNIAADVPGMPFAAKSEELREWTNGSGPLAGKMMMFCFDGISELPN